MLCISRESANEAFIWLAKKIINSPDYTSNPRKNKTKEILNVSVEISNPYDRIVYNKERKISLKYLIGEWLWYERGSNKLKEIEYYSKFWKKLSDDGKTVNSAYGKSFFLKDSDNLSQWEKVVNELKKDEDSRRAVLYIDRVEDINSKDVPCTVNLQFLIRGNKLYLTTNMRSNDLFLGFPYDVACFTLFQEKMLIELRQFYPNLIMGKYIHNVVSMHIYEEKFDQFDKIINAKQEEKIIMPRIKNLESIKEMNEEESIIRLKEKRKKKYIEDDFFNWCISALKGEY